MPFEPIQRVNIADAIMAQILRLIEIKELAVGARIPSESDLCQQFDTGRTSVREALKGLEAMGLITRSRQGTFVAKVSPWITASMAAKQTSIAELYETRRVLEAELAAMAAERASDEELTEIEQAIVAADAAVNGDPDTFLQLDMEVHTRIAAAAHNGLLLRLFAAVRDELVREHFDATAIPNVIAESVENHRELLAAIKAGDATGARQLVHERLSTVQVKFVEYVRRREQGD